MTELSDYLEKVAEDLGNHALWMDLAIADAKDHHQKLKRMHPETFDAMTAAELKRRYDTAFTLVTTSMDAVLKSAQQLQKIAERLSRMA